MKIAISGYNGFIGRSLMKRWKEGDFIKLERDILYKGGTKLEEKLNSADVIINLSGAPIARRWNRHNKDIILSSRIDITKNIVSALNNIDKSLPSKILLNASAIGIYSVNEAHTESSQNFENDFVSQVVQKWESEAGKLQNNHNLVIMRFGIVLGRGEGALKRLEKVFKIGLGGKIATGNQIYSFIHIEDVINAIDFIIARKLTGTFNFTSPYPISNKRFVKSIGHAMNKPALFPVPAFMLRIIMGNAARIVTTGHTVYPERLNKEGFKFTFADVNHAMENLYSGN